jgi:hypothetical protein
MIDIDAAITRELEAMVPVVARPDWEAVARMAGLRRPSRRRPLLAVAVVAAAVVIAVATPLGAAIARGFGGFSEWVAGEPGTPASRQAQHRFAQANARAWLGFPKGTQLRHLITTRVSGATVTLFGFRAGSSLCLRVSVLGSARGGTTNCAPVADLRRQDAPVRVVVSDQPFGRGAKTAWYGIDRVHAPLLQVTAGIADDTVRSVILSNGRVRTAVPSVANAFLYVAERPAIGQRVARVWARTAAGLTAVPYSPIPFGFGFGQPSMPAGPKVSVAVPARNGRIVWLEHHERRGAALSALPGKVRVELLGFRGGGSHSRILFGRVLTPDPTRPLRIVVTLNASRHGGRAAGVCTATVTRGGAGGGCSPYPQLFAKTPVSFTSFGGGSQQFIDVSGIVSDSVAHLKALLENRQTIDVPLSNNAFAVQLPLAHLPARLVAYDNGGRVVGLSERVEGFGSQGPAQAPGKAKQLLAVRGPNGAHEELLVGPGTHGSECVYVKHYFSKFAAGVMEGCHSTTWQGPPVQLETSSFPVIFIDGRVRNDVARVRIVFADGSTTTIAPTRGYVLAVLDRAHQTFARRPVRFVGLGDSGAVLGTQKLPRPPKQHR